MIPIMPLFLISEVGLTRFLLNNGNGNTRNCNSNGKTCDNGIKTVTVIVTE
jgi:hypothetical protein